MAINELKLDLNAPLTYFLKWSVCRFQIFLEGRIQFYDSR